MELMVIMMRSRRITTVMPVVPPTVPVAVWKTYMKGKPVGEAMASATLPMQNRYVIKRPNVKGTLSRNVQTMLFGTTRPASSISSAMCATESDPRTTNIVLTWPTNVAHPTLGQPAPLSVKLRNTSWADCLGDRTSKMMMIGKKAKTWNVTKTPSASGRRFAAKMLKSPMQMTEAMMSRVPCHLVGMYEASLMTIKPWIMTPTM